VLRLVDSNNLLIDDMARPTSEMARVNGALPTAIFQNA